MSDSARASSRPSLQVVAGRYQILRKIGSGGMGAVYIAKQVGVGNQVALKFLPAHLSDDPQLRRRFEREAALSLEINHPGAAQLLDTGMDSDGQLYLAFEYVAGDDLSALLDREGALSFDDAITLTCKVAEVLAFAHAKGVVHRDIKPENIRVRRDLAGLYVKVLDFGIARLVDEVGTKLTVEGGVAGTPRYMAPEQIGAGTIDARTDIYALGLVLFEAVTGREAFTRETTSQLMWAQLHDPVPPLVDVQPLRDYPALDAVIAQACAKDPAQRFASAQDLVVALKALQAPQWWGVPLPVPRRARASYPDADAAQGPLRDAVQLPRPGRKTFLQIRASAWAGIAVGVAALGLAGAALWVALDQRKVVATPSAVIATTAPAAVAVLPTPRSPANQTKPSTPSAPPVPVVTVSANTEPAKVASASGEMPECAQLSVYEDSPLAKMTVAALERQAHAVKYMAPSVAAKQVLALKASADTFHPYSRECLYRAKLIQMVLSEKVVLSSSPTLWGHRHDMAELERQFLEQPLKNDWTLVQRKDVLKQVETLFIANLQKEAPGDDAYWRRMYYGILLACEVSDDARSKVGAPRISENNCLKLKPAGS